MSILVYIVLDLYHTLDHREAPKVPQMRHDIRHQPRRIPHQIHRSLIYLKIRRPHRLIVRLVDIVLWADMRKVHDNRRYIGHRIVPVRNTVITTCLRGDVVCELQARHAWCAIRIHRHRVARVSQVGSC